MKKRVPNKVFIPRKWKLATLTSAYSEIWSHAWVNLGGIMLCEASSHRGTNTVWLYLHKMSRVIKFMKMERGMVLLVRVWWTGKRRILYNSCSISDLHDKNILEIYFTTILPNCAFKSGQGGKFYVFLTQKHTYFTPSWFQYMW